MKYFLRKRLQNSIDKNKQLHAENDKLSKTLAENMVQESFDIAQRDANREKNINLNQEVFISIF